MIADIVQIVPVWFQYGFVFLLGAIIGSFLDVVVTRFHTNASLNGRSRCLSCSKTLVWYELVPFVSYVVLLGRCYGCSARIPQRLFWMEVVSGLMFVAVYNVSAPVWWLVLFSFVLIATLLVVTMYDIEHMIIPHGFVYTLGLLAAVWWLIQLFLTVYTLVSLVMSLSAALLCASFYAGLWWYSGGRWIGLGDAKLALPLASLLPPIATFSFVVLSFWVGAVLSVAFLLWQRAPHRGQPLLQFRRSPLTMKSEVPFAPFMIIAFLLVWLYDVDVLAIMGHFIYGF